MSRATILIAPAETIPILRQQPYLREARAFAHTDTAPALDQIRQDVPALIAIERLFAATLDGQALVHQITADQQLAGCQVQMVGVRQSPRHRLVEQVFIDGSAGTLLDISTTGAHVLGTSPIQPAQRVYLAMKAGAPPLTAFAVWVQYELPKEGARYRAGVEFTASAAAAVADYVAELSR